MFIIWHIDGILWKITEKERIYQVFFIKQPTIQCKLTYTDLSMHRNQLNTLHSYIRSPQTIFVYQ